MFLHAHPDDETSLTAGMMAMASARGARVVTIFATGGEYGTVPPDLPSGVTLTEHRRGEAEAAAEATGSARIVWLGYEDSGMTGWAENERPESLVQADPRDVADAVVAVLAEEDSEVLIGYDWHGNYGHPDHLTVHRAGRLAVERTRRPVRLLEATVRRESYDEARELPEAAELMAKFGFPDGMPDDAWEKLKTGDDGLPSGMPEAEITWQISLNQEALRRKREAMACHSSQSDDIGIMLELPPGLYRHMFGTEYLVDPGQPGPPVEHWPF